MDPKHDGKRSADRVDLMDAEVLAKLKERSILASIADGMTAEQAEENWKASVAVLGL